MGPTEAEPATGLFGPSPRSASTPMNRERRPAPRRTLPGTFTAAPKPNTRQPSSGKPGMARQAPQGKPKASMPRPALSVGRRDKDRMVELADDDMQDLLRPQVCRARSERGGGARGAGAAGCAACPLRLGPAGESLPRSQSAERGRDGEVIADVDVAGSRGRITVYCVADAIDMKDLHSHAKKVYQYGVFKHYPEVLHHIFAEVTPSDSWYLPATLEGPYPFGWVSTGLC